MSNYVELTEYNTDIKTTIAIDSIRAIKLHPKGDGTAIYFKNLPDTENRIVKESYRDIKHNLQISTQEMNII